MRYWKAVLVLVGLAVVLGGCTEDEPSPLGPDSGTNIPDSALPFPATPDQVIANFMTIYESMDIDEYKLILDPAFETHLATATMRDFPAVGATLDTAEENRIHGRLFAGEGLVDSGGGPLPAILAISFSKINKVIDWGETLPSDPIPRTLSALYDVEILVDRGQNYSTLKVDGQIRFYAKPASGLVDGQPRPYYRLVGQNDLTRSGKGVEEIAWGSLKALYY